MLGVLPTRARPSMTPGPAMLSGPSTHNPSLRLLSSPRQSAGCPREVLFARVSAASVQLSPSFRRLSPMERISGSYSKQPLVWRATTDISKTMFWGFNSTGRLPGPGALPSPRDLPTCPDRFVKVIIATPRISVNSFKQNF